ncbi:MAG: hypothetical protein RSA01_10850 [Clostridium sp.]|uniref:hypothetical protein n=1 Tax=Clostridium sp. TaxID=1506 RepID=UPI002FC9F00C
MGALYREDVKCDDKGIFRGIIVGTLTTYIVLLLAVLPEVVMLGEYYLLVLAVGGAVTIGAILFSKRKMNRIYRYEIIDNEIIIEDVTNGKRVVKLNFKAKNIVILDSCSCKVPATRVYKKYDFTLNPKHNLTKTCIFEKDGKLYRFAFEPSNALIDKIEALRCNKGLA